MRRIQIGLIAFFLLFLAAPAIQYCFPIVHADVVLEKRAKTAWPAQSFWSGVRGGGNYANDVEQYFSDHFPFRDAMLRALGQAEYSLLGTAREVIIGKDGWLCDRQILLDQIPELDRIDESRIQTAIVRLKRFQNWLQHNGTEFLIVVVPLKPTVYPEKYPHQYVERLDPTGLMRFQSALKKNDIPFIDALKILNEHKDETPLYFKTDMHWNSAGVAYIAEAIVDHFSQEMLHTRLWHEQMSKSETPFIGEESNTVPSYRRLSERAPSWTSVHLAYEEWNEKSTSTMKAFRGTDADRALLPPSIMFGNSFTLRYPAVGYHNYFSESDRVLDYQDFSRVLDYVQPKHKIFILHIYETQLLMHIFAPDSTNYWDKRIDALPLPSGFEYQ